MKYLKLFENENFTVQSVRNIVVEHHKFTEYIKPAIIEKYYQLVDDKDYEAEYGDQPKDVLASELSLDEIEYYNDGFHFCIHSYNKNEISGSYYIDVTNDELDEMLVKLEGKKYNL